MRQFVAIAANTFMELIRQPVLLLLTTASGAFIVFLAVVPYFGLGDDAQLVKQSVLAIMLLAGLLGSVLCASSTLSREIRTGTALTVLAKPVSRAQFLLAKFAGLALALALLNYVNTVAALYASRMAFDAYGDPDVSGFAIWLGGLVAGYLAGGFANYFLRRPFTSNAMIALAVTATIAFLINASLTKADPTSRGLTIAAFVRVEWQLVPMSALILLALWMLAALALACSARLELMATLAICTAFFLLGLMWNWLVGRPAEAGMAWAKVLYPLMPNWQNFWVGDVLDGKKAVNWSGYLGSCLAYTVCYVGATLLVALALFEDRELA
jgi:ABC-type transport system involved in multi-copper enzyme maturation permease subunit